MKKKETFQLKIDSARFYEQNFVPTLFTSWAKSIVAELELKKSENLLDIACGTGIVLRTARNSGVDHLKLTGCDINDGMLQVAKEIEPEILWVKGNAESLPFDNKTFEKVSCQFGFMFFEDQVKCLNEMLRVLKDNGRISLGIWDTIESNEGYYDLLQLLERIDGGFGQILKSPFTMGDKMKIIQVINSSKVSNYNIKTIKNQVEFPSIKHWIDCDVKASPISEKITDYQYSELLKEAKEKLEKYVTNEGRVRFEMSGHIVTIE